MPTKVYSPLLPLYYSEPFRNRTHFSKSYILNVKQTTVRLVSCAHSTNQYDVALNNAIRRLFGFRQWQSIRQLREIYGYDSIEMMFQKAKKRFYDSLSDHPNGVLRFLSAVQVEVE